VARDVGAHVLPRGEGVHVVVVLYHAIMTHLYWLLKLQERFAFHH
jgi:hypothetical protein